jgi:hypothetical protein
VIDHIRDNSLALIFIVEVYAGDCWFKTEAGAGRNVKGNVEGEIYLGRGGIPCGNGKFLML